MQSKSDEMPFTTGEQSKGKPDKRKRVYGVTVSQLVSASVLKGGMLESNEP